MKKLILILMALLLAGCIYGRYPRHMEVEVGGGGGYHEEHHEGHHDEGREHDERR